MAYKKLLLVLQNEDYLFGSINIFLFKFGCFNLSKSIFNSYRELITIGIILGFRAYIVDCEILIVNCVSKIDGFSLAEKIITLNPETPFVFLTARKLKEDKITGLKLGADDYIIKTL